MKKWIAILIAALTLTTTVSVTALAVSTARERVYWSYHGWSGRNKYTQADYKQAMALKTEDYDSMSVGAFDKLVADWTDETAFHQSETSLNRLFYTYEKDGDNADFIRLTLKAAFVFCETKHYGGYCTSQTPSYSDGVGQVREEDVFGDKYPVFEAEVDYTICYQVPDEEKLTVGERDSLLLAYRAEVQAFLDGRTEKELLNEDAMERSLKKELARLDKNLSTDKMVLTGTLLDSYYAYNSSEGHTIAENA